MASKKTKRKGGGGGGSVEISRRGLLRGGGEVNPGAPERFCSIDGPNDGDMPLAELLDRYKGNRWAQAVIRACVDEKRATEGAEPFFWHRLRDGVTDPIKYVDLGEDRFGEIILPIVNGRHRKAGLILVNIEREGSAEPEPLVLPALALRLPKGEANAEKAAAIVLRVKNDSNIYNPMKPSHLAARATEHAAAGNTFWTIAQKLALLVDADGADQVVPWYLALAQAVPEIQEAADTGKIEVRAIGKICKPSGDLKLSPAEQRTWLAARLAPKTRVAKSNGHGRPLTPRKVAAFLGELKDERAVLLFGLTLGTVKIDTVTDRDIRAAWLRAFGGER